MTNAEASGAQSAQSGDLAAGGGDPANNPSLINGVESGQFEGSAITSSHHHHHHNNQFGSRLGLGSNSFSSAPRQLISGKFVSMGDGPEKGPTSLFIFEENNVIRLKTRAIIENSIFEYSVLATIIANCVALAMEAHLPNNDKTEIAIIIVSTI